MNRGLVDAAGLFLNGGLADNPFPLTPALSLWGGGAAVGTSAWGVFIVPMRLSRILRLSMDRRMNMPLLRSLGMAKGASAAIDMALLRSFANRFMVPIQAQSEANLSISRRTLSLRRPPFLQGRRGRR